jgi:nucleotide-binding universal stress UspA family protein
MPEMRPYQRILALIHFDDLDGQTAEKALLLARLNQAKLDFLHLIEPDGVLDGGYPSGNSQSTARSLETASLRRLNFLAAQLGAPEATCHALHGPLRQGFLQHIRKWQPDLIVTGEHHAYLAGSHDVLILSASKRRHRGKLLARLMNLFSSQNCAAGL